MDLRRYGRVLAGRRVLVLTVFVLALVAATVFVHLSPTTASSSVVMAVIPSPSAAGQSADKAYADELLAQQRATAAAALVLSDEVIRRVAVEASAKESEVRGALTVSVPAGTPLVQVAASATTPSRANAIVRAVASVLPQYLAQIGGPGDAVRLVVAQPPSPPVRSSPSRTLIYLLAVVLGFVVAMIAAAIVEAADRRVRVISDVREIVDAPVVVGVPAAHGLRRAPDADAAQMLATQLRRAAPASHVTLIANASPAAHGRALTTALVSALGSGKRQISVVRAQVDADEGHRHSGRLSTADTANTTGTTVPSWDVTVPAAALSAYLADAGAAGARVLIDDVELPSCTHHAAVAADHDAAAVLVAAAGKTQTAALAEAASILWLLKLPVVAVVLTRAPGRRVRVDVQPMAEPEVVAAPEAGAVGKGWRGLERTAKWPRPPLNNP